MGPGAIRLASDHVHRATRDAETVDPRERVVHVGSRSLVLPATPGFVMVGPELPEFLEGIEASVIDNTRRVVSLVSEETHAKLLKGEPTDLERLLYADVSRRLEDTRFTPAVFAEMKVATRKLHDELRATLNKKSPELYAKLERDAGRSFSERERAAITDVMRLPPHRDTERVFANSAFKHESSGTISVTTWSMLLVKDVLIHLKVAGRETDLEWSRQVADQWSDAVLAANAR